MGIPLLRHAFKRPPGRAVVGCLIDLQRDSRNWSVGSTFRPPFVHLPVRSSHLPPVADPPSARRQLTV